MDSWSVYLIILYDSDTHNYLGQIEATTAVPIYVITN